MTSAFDPQRSTSLDEVRAQIDRIDTALVRLLAERQGHVHAAAAFKRSEEEVRAPARVEQVIANVRALAAREGADPDLVERIYREMIAAYTDLERRRWQAQQQQQ